MSQRESAMAIAAHPDDIEFLMSGTLMHLRNAGYEIHYLNLSSGNLGSESLPEDAIVEIRAQEAKAAALMLGAVWHPPFCCDLEILYEVKFLRHLSGIIRDVAPSIILTHSPTDYMEDHTTTSRLAVTAAFSRGMPNFATVPPRDPITSPIAIYHAQPHMNRDDMGKMVSPDFAVDVTSLIDKKRQALEIHKSQKDWLDASQGLNAYITTMENNLAEVAGMTNHKGFAEGWRPHSKIGFCPPDFTPLESTLAGHIHSLTKD